MAALPYGTNPGTTLIGIILAIFKQGHGEGQTIAFAIPSERLQSIIPELKISSELNDANRENLIYSDSTQSPQSPIRFAVSGFSADIRTERDLIGIGAEVDAFAYLITAKALQLPMAIGLFDDWGFGKNFFMESLCQRIHQITADA